MNYQRKSIRAARWSRTKAFFFTLLFHLGILFALACGGNMDWKEYLPDTVKSWLEIETDSQKDAEELRDYPRP